MSRCKTPVGPYREPIDSGFNFCAGRTKDDMKSKQIEWSTFLPKGKNTVSTDLKSVKNRIHEQKKNETTFTRSLSEINIKNCKRTPVMQNVIKQERERSRGELARMSYISTIKERRSSSEIKPKTDIMTSFSGYFVEAMSKV